MNTDGPHTSHEFCPRGVSRTTRDFGAERSWRGAESSASRLLASGDGANSARKGPFDLKTQSGFGAKRRNRAPEGRPQGVPPGPALDIRGNSVTTRCPLDPHEDAAREAQAIFERERKIRRYQRRILRKVSKTVLPNESVARCGRYLARRAGVDHPEVAIKVAEGHAYLSGVVTCGSVWHCPVCAHKIAETRRKELESVINAHVGRGGTVYMAVLTVPHSAFDKCGTLRRAVAQAWQKVQAGDAWKRTKARDGILGSVRALEVTHGANGWHPHLHVLFFLEGDDPGAAAHFAEFLFQRWSVVVRRFGMGECNRAAWRWEKARSAQQAGEYVTKWGSDYEITRAHMKLAKYGQRSPWQILADIQEYEVPEDIELFREYALAFKGARQLTWSRGLRELYLTEAEASDEELAEVELPDAVTVAYLSKRGFELVRDRGLECRLLESVEDHGWRGILAFCARYQVPLCYFRLGTRVESIPAKPVSLTS